MLLIIALVIASLFVYFLKDKLKQYPNIFLHRCGSCNDCYIQPAHGGNAAVCTAEYCGHFCKGNDRNGIFYHCHDNRCIAERFKAYRTAHADSRGIVHYGGNSGAFAQPDLWHDIF